MYIAKDRNDILIIRGYRWHRFAAALVVVLCTPLWVWLASFLSDPMDRLIAMGAAAITPLSVFLGVWKTFKNWTLVFEADYDFAAFYQSRWGKRQVAEKFSLSDVKDAELLQHVKPYRTKSGQIRESYSYSLALNLRSPQRQLILGTGDEIDIYRMQSGIKQWLARRERLQLVSTKAAVVVDA